MALFQNEKLLESIEIQIEDVNEKMRDPLICEPFVADFSRRFCWSSNAIEGNTLSLDETVAFIDFDEVRRMCILGLLWKRFITHHHIQMYRN